MVFLKSFSDDSNVQVELRHSDLEEMTIVNKVLKWFALTPELLLLYAVTII